MKLCDLIATLKGLQETSGNDNMDVDVYCEGDGHTVGIVAVYTWKEDAVVITVRHDSV